MTATAVPPSRRVGLTPDRVRSFSAELRVHHRTIGGAYKTEPVDNFIERVAVELEVRDQSELKHVQAAERASRALKQWQTKYLEASGTAPASEGGDTDAPFRPRDEDIATGIDAQLQADRELARARKQIAGEWAAHRVRVAEAERLLREARDAAAPSTQAAVDWPVEPQPTGNPSVDLVAEKEHQQRYRAALDTARHDIEARERALGERHDEFVKLLDQLLVVVPDVLAQLVAVPEVETVEDVPA